MEQHLVKITEIQQLTHDVRAYRMKKPDGYSFTPGQGTEVAINSDGLKEQKRPFTFTGVNTDPYLEFIIKSYGDRKGVTNALGRLKPGDELIIHDAWDTLSYDERAVFIAAGSGITPFVSMLRHGKKNNLKARHLLINANKTAADIILGDEIASMPGVNFVNILSREKRAGFHHGRINLEFLQKTISDFDQKFYVCGPPDFVTDINSMLISLGARSNMVSF